MLIQITLLIIQRITDYMISEATPRITSALYLIKSSGRTVHARMSIYKSNI